MPQEIIGLLDDPQHSAGDHKTTAAERALVAERFRSLMASMTEENPVIEIQATDGEATTPRDD